MERSAQQSSSQDKLQELIPIAVVIAAGCEPCAKRMVEQALAQGTAPGQIRKVIAIVEHMKNLDCLAAAVGPEVTARMHKPLDMARRMLKTMTKAQKELAFSRKNASN